MITSHEMTHQVVLKLPWDLVGWLKSTLSSSLNILLAMLNLPKTVLCCSSWTTSHPTWAVRLLIYGKQTVLSFRLSHSIGPITLDISVTDPLKSMYSRGIDSWLKIHPGKTWFTIVRNSESRNSECFHTFHHNFRVCKCGIFSFNPDKFQIRDCRIFCHWLS